MVRVIVLCAMVSSQSSQLFWDTAQSQWMQNVLSDALQNGKYVVCVNHTPFDKNSAELVASKWTSYYAKKWKNDTGHIAFDNLHTSPEAVENVYSFINNGGHFVCWLTGHLHFDSIQKITSKQQVMVNIASANCDNHPDGAKTNNIREYLFDCFNYIGIDINNHIIKVFRFGWDTDASLRIRKILSYDFVENQIETEN